MTKLDKFMYNLMQSNLWTIVDIMIWLTLVFIDLNGLFDDGKVSALDCILMYELICETFRRSCVESYIFDVLEENKLMKGVKDNA